MLNQVCEPLFWETKDLQLWFLLILCAHDSVCQFQILCSLHLELLHRTDVWRSIKAFISTWSCLYLMSEWDTNTLFNVTGLTPNSTRQVSLIFKMVLWVFVVFFFKNLSSKNLTIKPNYVKQYQPSKDYYKIWVMSLRNWLLRQIKWHFIKSQPYGIKRTVRKLEQDSKQNTLIYLPSCPKSHEITESERERFKSREYESGSFNFLI